MYTVDWISFFHLQEAKHQNEEMKKKKEQEERKARAMAEVKIIYHFRAISLARWALMTNDVACLDFASSELGKSQKSATKLTLKTIPYILQSHEYPAYQTA